MAEKNGKTPREENTPEPTPIEINAAQGGAPAEASTQTPTLAESLTVLGLMLIVGISLWLLYGPIIAAMLRAILRQPE